MAYFGQEIEEGSDVGLWTVTSGSRKSVNLYYHGLDDLSYHKVDA